MAKIAIFVALLLAFALQGRASEPLSFDDFPVDEVYAGKSASPPIGPQISKRRREALAQPVNFAGHYVVYFYPCGGGCITGSVLDVKTARISAGLPDVYVVDTFNAEFKPTSRLMVITGKSAYGGSVTTKFYEFSEDHFTVLR